MTQRTVLSLATARNANIHAVALARMLAQWEELAEEVEKNTLLSTDEVIIWKLGYDERSPEQTGGIPGIQPPAVLAGRAFRGDAETRYQKKGMPGFVLFTEQEVALFNLDHTRLAPENIAKWIANALRPAST